MVLKQRKVHQQLLLLKSDIEVVHIASWTLIIRPCQFFHPMKRLLVLLQWRMSSKSFFRLDALVHLELVVCAPNYLVPCICFDTLFSTDGAILAVADTMMNSLFHPYIHHFLSSADAQFATQCSFFVFTKYE